MAERITHRGRCHCGEVRFEVDATIDSVVACNCSICRSRGWLLAFVAGTDFRLVSGEGALTDYMFGRQRIHHLFCSRCGASSFTHGVGPDGTETVAVNVLCLEDFDFETLPVHHFDGRAL